MKIKLTKGELKRQRDALRQYRRFLPTLQLKKQQLQLAILHEVALAGQRSDTLSHRKSSAEVWAGLLSDESVDISAYLAPKAVLKSAKNIAGVDVPVFEKAEFDTAEYDLFLAPMWVDNAVDALREIKSLTEEIAVIQEGINVLRKELRTTSQRVNLFEKIKIPGAEEAVRLIKIYIGDQLTNAVGRSKIAKRKIEEAAMQGVA